MQKSSKILKASFYMPSDRTFQADREYIVFAFLQYYFHAKNSKKLETLENSEKDFSLKIVRFSQFTFQFKQSSSYFLVQRKKLN